MDVSQNGKRAGEAATDKLKLYIEEEKSSPDLATRMKATVSELWSGTTRFISSKIGKR